MRLSILRRPPRLPPGSQTADFAWDPAAGPHLLCLLAFPPAVPPPQMPSPTTTYAATAQAGPTPGVLLPPGHCAPGTWQPGIGEPRAGRQEGPVAGGGRGASSTKGRGAGLGSWPEGGSLAPRGPSALTVNRELVRKTRGQARLVVHSSMERDVGLLRLYPGIPASLVGPAEPPPECPRSHAPRAPQCGHQLALPACLAVLPPLHMLLGTRKPASGRAPLVPGGVVSRARVGDLHPPRSSGLWGLISPFGDVGLAARPSPNPGCWEPPRVPVAGREVGSPL